MTADSVADWLAVKFGNALGLLFYPGIFRLYGLTQGFLLFLSLGNLHQIAVLQLRQLQLVLLYSSSAFRCNFFICYLSLAICSSFVAMSFRALARSPFPNLR